MFKAIAIQKLFNEYLDKLIDSQGIQYLIELYLIFEYIVNQSSHQLI